MGLFQLIFDKVFKLKLYITVLFTAFNFSVEAQILFSQNSFNGGVTAVGFSTGQGLGSDSIHFFIEPGSTIKRAVVFSYKAQNEAFHPIYLNNIQINYADSDRILTVNHLNPGSDTIHILHKDITTIISNITTNAVKVEIPIHPFSNSASGIWCAFLYIEYENLSMPLVNSAVWINDQFLDGLEQYNMNDLNPVDVNFPVALSVMMDRSCAVPHDGTLLRLNGDVLGLSGGDSLGHIWGEDNSSINSCNGVKGHFYYQNNTLFGLDDDTANFIMNHWDGLADISPYLAQNTTDYFLTTRHANIPGNAANRNVNVLFINTYTTSCSNFNVSLNTTDTTICKNEPLQLQVTGGNTYQWQPSEGLSCSDCPNPIVLTDKSRVYTVTVNNTDSCSKTIPVVVKVNEPPVFGDIVLRSDTCGLNVGAVLVQQISGMGPFTYQMNGNSQTSPNHYNVKGGYQLLSVSGANGCVQDTLLYVPSVKLTKAGFTVNPQIGEMPLKVDFTNQSMYANNWVWFINGDTLTNQNPSYLFTTADTFEVIQVAYYNTKDCADTAYATIKVFIPIEITIPNVFTPNNDAVNDMYTIQIKGARKVYWEIINRWGAPVNYGEEEISTDFTLLDLWNGEGLNYDIPVNSGVYFYRIIVKSPADVTEIYTGAVTLLK